MSDITIIPVACGSSLPLETVRVRIQTAFRCTVAVSEASVHLASAFDPSRHQYHSGDVLASLLSAFPGRGKLLGITGMDLFLPVLTFVFGQAQLNDRAAVFSTFRLRNEYYGLPPDAGLLIARSLKEGIHELGHTFGLHHCRDNPCVMNSSTYVEDIDIKPETFCMACLETLARAEKSPP